jgi:hypothetical protein
LRFLVGVLGHPKTRPAAAKLRLNVLNIPAEGIGIIPLNRHRQAVPFCLWPKLTAELVGDFEYYKLNR